MHGRAGRSGGLVARLTPARPDLAADFLEGQVSAERFAKGRTMQISASVLPIRRAPASDAPQETQGLYGELFTVYEEKDGFGWGQAGFDGYVGYVDMEGLSAPADPPSHRVTAVRTYRYSDADLKSAPLGLVSMNAKVAVTARSDDGRYVRDSRGGWVFTGHLAPLDFCAADPVVVMERFLGTPYFWGGRESLGLDCSGLIQNGYEAAGLPVPRDADLQEEFFSDTRHGEEIFVLDDDRGDEGWGRIQFQRGDLVFWKGHVGVLVDERRLLHANATHMAVTLDVLADMAAHIERSSGTPVRRVVRPRAISLLQERHRAEAGA